MTEIKPIKQDGQIIGYYTDTGKTLFLKPISEQDFKLLKIALEDYLIAINET